MLFVLCVQSVSFILFLNKKKFKPQHIKESKNCIEFHLTYSLLKEKRMNACLSRLESVSMCYVFGWLRRNIYILNYTHIQHNELFILTTTVTSILKFTGLVVYRIHFAVVVKVRIVCCMYSSLLLLFEGDKPSFPVLTFSFLLFFHASLGLKDLFFLGYFSLD